MTLPGSLPDFRFFSFHEYWMGPGTMGWGYGMGIVGALMMLLFWVLILIGLVYLIKWLAQSSRHGAAREETALDLLKKRYAKGEISKEEFEEKKKDIQ
ncbi:MAG: SHOCT domain-containing protein [Actinomycetota bacterium]|nr:SHOCT domain-containing protein [Actinomycetota bacterium]